MKARNCRVTSRDNHRDSNLKGNNLRDNSRNVSNLKANGLRGSSHSRDSNPRNRYRRLAFSTHKRPRIALTDTDESRDRSESAAVSH